MNKKTFLIVATMANLCNAQELDNTLRYDVNGNVLCDSYGFYYSKKGDRISRLSLFDEECIKKIMLLLNNNYQAPQICYDGCGLLLMIVSPQDSVFEIRQLRSYSSLIDSAIHNAIIKTEPLLPTLLNTCDSSFCAPLMINLNNR